MCGRYGLFAPKKVIQDHYQLEEDIPDIIPRYNIPPGSVMPVIVKFEGRNILRFMKWGLVPSWAKDETIGYKMINARIETLEEKPSYKNLLIHNRCLIPASGFFEWKKLDKTKQPYFIHIKDTTLFSFAGLWTTWKKKDGNELYTYTIITTLAEERIASIHERMPVILNKEMKNYWMTNKNIIISNDMHNYSAPAVSAYTISSRINNPINDDIQIIQVESDI